MVLLSWGYGGTTTKLDGASKGPGYVANKGGVVMYGADLNVC